MRHRLLLQILVFRPRNSRSLGYTMLAGMLVILSLLVGTLGLVAIVNGANLGAYFSGDVRDSQAVAEAGANLIIATFNEPENRQLLVAGSTPPSEWSTTNPNLRSPCQSSTGERPGERNDGLPTQEAINIANGSLRDLANPESPLADNPPPGSRAFKLVAVRYSTGEKGSRDRRSIYRTFFLDKTKEDDAGTIQPGKTFKDLNNLDVSNGSAGNDSGFMTLVVEGQLYKADGTHTTATITKEFEVVPKCCGGSFGSNGSGGTTKTDGSIPTNSLGADSRYCESNYGFIVGINGGRIGTSIATYISTVNSNDQVVSFPEIVGVIRDENDTWDRRTKRERTITINYGNTEKTYTAQVGCRTEPSICNTNNDAMDWGHRFNSNGVESYPESEKSNMQDGFNSELNWSPPKAAPTNTFQPKNCNTIDKGYYYGTSFSCYPIKPTYLPNLPSINTNYVPPRWRNNDGILGTIARANGNDVVDSWSEGCTYRGNRNFVVNTNANSKYPCIYADYSSWVSSKNITDFQTWLRANSATKVSGRLIPGPFLEYCNTKYLPYNSCASAVDGSGTGNHTWAVISEAGEVTGGISDDFESNSFSGWKANSTARWPKPWEVNDRALWGLTNESIGDVQIESISNNKAVTFQKYNNLKTWGTNDAENAPAIARAVNLYALKDPVLEFTVKIEGKGDFKNNSALKLSYAYDYTNRFTTDAAINTDTGWDDLATMSAGGVASLKSNELVNNELVNGKRLRDAPAGNCVLRGTNTYTCWVQFPRAAYGPINPYSHFVKFRLRANSTFGGDDQINKVTLDDVAIKSYSTGSTNYGNPTYLNWCEYSSTFPETRAFTGGFHCLGPTIHLVGPGNNLFIDTTDASISFYYSNKGDRRGVNFWDPLIIVDKAIMSNVVCNRDSPNTTRPTDNCKRTATVSAVNRVGQAERFNIFGRDTPPFDTCNEAGFRMNQPCQQFVNIQTSTMIDGIETRLAGTWIGDFQESCHSLAAI